MLLDFDPAHPLQIVSGPPAGDDGARRLTLSGELDLASAPQLDSRLREELDAGRGVELELVGIRFIDSTGIGVLVDGLRAFGAAGLRFALRGPLPAQMRRVLEIAGLLERFPIVDPA